MGQAVKKDVVPDNFPISQEGILGTDFFKDSIYLTDIRYNVKICKMTQYRNSIYKDGILIPAKIAKAFYIKIKNPKSRWD